MKKEEAYIDFLISKQVKFTEQKPLKEELTGNDIKEKIQKAMLEDRDLVDKS